MPVRNLLLILVLCCLPGATVLADTVRIPVGALGFTPEIDGRGHDWAALPATRLALRGKGSGALDASAELLLRAGVRDGRVYFWLSWEDRVPSLSVKPWQVGRDPATRREDRVTLKFDAPNQAQPDWLTDWSFTADTWHWRSSTRHPRGLVHDKATVVSRHSRGHPVADGVERRADLHRAASRSAAEPIELAAAVAHADALPRYDLGDRVIGSATDVQSQARWRDGRWELEMSRRLDTGHADDVVFRPGAAYRLRISVSASSAVGEFATTRPLELKFDY